MQVSPASGRSTPPVHRPIAYRPDIDGLRAIAVLAVFAFHIGLFPVLGGFVGVDIFFVISGYLIGRSIHDDIAAGRFSIVQFYERRFRRILPALFAMLLVTTVAAWALLYPAALVDYGWSLLAAALSYANIFFWQTTGYFAGPAESKTLLHTWSLGVEEQYYLVFPLFLGLLHRYAPRHLTKVVWSVAGVSFLWAGVGAFVAPTPTFYLLPTRTWELLLGFIVALTRLPALERKQLREGMAGFGLILIMVSVIATLTRFPFPGLTALPPCLGAGLVILAGSHGPSRAGKLLSLRPVTFVGLVSYSFYLWHWPLIVFARQSLLIPLSGWRQQLLAFCITLALATLSWRFVERPFRGTTNVSRRAVFTGALLACFAAAGVTAIFASGKGWPSRFAAPVARMAGFLDYEGERDYRAGSCFLVSDDDFAKFRLDACLRTDPTRANVLLLGDSHAAHLYYGLVHRFPSIQWLQANTSGCKPVTGAMKSDAGACVAMRRFMYDRWLPHHRVDLVILSALWAPGDEAALARTLDWFRARQIQVVLAGPVPDYYRPLPQLLAEAMRRHDPSLPARFAAGDRPALDASLAAVAHAHRVPYVSPYHRLCGPTSCLTAVNDTPIQFDGSHLTRVGSLIVASAFDPVLAPLAGRARPNTGQAAWRLER